jgi:ketosteroid isomerase-like protein
VLGCTPQGRGAGDRLFLCFDLAAATHSPLAQHEGAQMSAPLPDVVSRYFQFEAERDVDAILALFADDATVLDEGATRHGATEIREWQVGPASKYTYTTDVKAGEALGPDRYLVTGRLTGNFPGGTADLKWDFTIAQEHITRLVIEP